MELISKDKLKEVIEPMVGKFDDDGEFWWSRESILRVIDNAPTIEERKEGEWNFIGWNQFECTCCHYPYTQDQLRAVTTRNGQIFPHFCPNCGAKMKGE